MTLLVMIYCLELLYFNVKSSVTIPMVMYHLNELIYQSISQLTVTESEQEQ